MTQLRDNEVVMSGVGSHAHNLVAWCSEHLDKDDWDVELLNLSPSRFKLTFKDPLVKTLALLNI